MKITEVWLEKHNQGLHKFNSSQNIKGRTDRRRWDGLGM
jgi:hypothetical protein